MQSNRNWTLTAIAVLMAVALTGLAQGDDPLSMLKKLNGSKKPRPDAAPRSTMASAPTTEDLPPEVFDPSDTRRDPFWPVGWKPPYIGQSREDVQAANRLDRWREALNRREVTGVSKKPDGAYLAVLRGIGVVEKGDIVRVWMDGQAYRWRITGVLQNGIETKRLIDGQED